MANKHGEISDQIQKSLYKTSAERKRKSRVKCNQTAEKLEMIVKENQKRKERRW